jgi:hypothetical protein
LVTGRTPDISEYVELEWYELLWYVVIKMIEKKTECELLSNQHSIRILPFAQD